MARAGDYRTDLHTGNDGSIAVILGCKFKTDAPHQLRSSRTIHFSLIKKLWEEPPNPLLVLLVRFTKQLCQLLLFGLCRRSHPDCDTQRK